jgi:hypothetical protein
MNKALYEYLDVFVIIYLDDILVYSKDLLEHVEHARKVLQKLKEYSLLLKLEKCKFYKT